MLAQQRLVGKPSEYLHPFEDPELNEAEQDALDEADERSRRWMRDVWMVIAGLIGTGLSVAGLARLLRETSQPPSMEQVARDIVRRAFEAGGKAAQRPAVRAEEPAKPGERAKIVLIPPFPKEQEPPGKPPAPPGGRPPGEPPREPPRGGGEERWRPPRGYVRAQAAWYARIAATEKMREWANGMRDDVRWQTVQAIREGVGADELARRLSQRWAHHGQNFHMIAVTELGDAYASGMLLAMPDHGYVTVLPIGDARVCDDCKELLESKVFEVLHQAPRNPSRLTEETCVWPGKSNVGRPRGQWVPCITLHPRCRHAFVPFSPDPYRRRSTEDDYHAR